MTTGPVDTRLLRAFVAVAEELHFGRAARRLHISQPPLSVQIRQLEAALDTRLFERSRRHVALTEAGSFLLARARNLLASTELACAEARRIGRGEAGVLRIGYTATASYEVLPALVPALRKLRPELQLELSELRSALQPQALRDGRIEIGFACGPLAAPDLQQRVLVRERMLVALPARHRLAAAAKVDARALAREPVIQVRPEIEPAWAEVTVQALAAEGVQLRLRQQTDSKNAMLGLVAAAEGISLVSESLARLGRRGVVFRELKGLALKVPLVVLAPLEPSPRAAELLRLATGWRAEPRRAAQN